MGNMLRVHNIVAYLFIGSLILLLFVIYWQHWSVSVIYGNDLSTAEVSTKYLKQCKAGFYFSQVNNSCLLCDYGSFSFQGWIGCHPWLDCIDIRTSVRTRRLLSMASQYNAVKHIYLADWNGFSVVYIRCSNVMYFEDCQHNTRMIEGFQGSEFVVQLLGSCEDEQEIVTMYYKHGSAEKLDDVLHHVPQDDKLRLRIQLARDYLQILKFLHDSPLGTRVMCDTNDLVKTLSQFLITDDFHLVVNDLDALPKVDHASGELVKCGHRELSGWFVAPEQLWPFDDKPFNDLDMPAYDEKIDIWRIPDVIIWFLGDSLEALKIKAELKDLFSSCKSQNPRSRPTAKRSLQIFEENILHNKDDHFRY